jgi:hypothetical protein
VLERLPVAATILLQRGDGWGVSSGFATSAPFASVVRDRRPLLDAAVDYFCEWVPRALLEFEAALSFDAHAVPSASLTKVAPEMVSLAPRVRVMSVPESLLTSYALALAVVEAAPGQDRWTRILAASQRRREALTLECSGPASFQLITPSATGGGASVEAVDGVLAAVMIPFATRTSVSIADLAARLKREAGLEEDEALELLTDVAAEGLIRIGSRSNATA